MLTQPWLRRCIGYVMLLLLQLWLTEIEIFAAIFAALIHDYEHTGTTNTFHVNTRYT